MLAYLESGKLPHGDHVMAGTGAGPSFRVLYVDDNRDAADSAVLLLQIVGFDARACYDGRTALKVAEAFRPTICMLDLHMPGMDGDEVAIRLRTQAWCPLLLVAVTAMSDEQSRERTTAAGFDAHFVKPVDPEKLVAVLDMLCRAADEKSRSVAVRKGDELSQGSE